MSAIPILLVDDDEEFRAVLTNELAHAGFKVTDVGTAEAAERLINRESFAVAVLDMQLPGKSGLEALQTFGQRVPDMEVIILTAYGDINGAVKAMRQGAFNYLTKPCSLDELEALIRDAARKSQLGAHLKPAKSTSRLQQLFPGFVGESEGFLRMLSLLEQVAASDSIVLVQGESGVGKELAARAVHRLSSRCDHPFVVIDCTTLQESLLESELFGHERGAYTSASGLKHGLFEVADGGTIFMDEIGELSSAIQAKLLRVIEQSSFRRVGGTQVLHVDVRFVFATNRDLQKLVDQNLFRSDLFYRLSGFPIQIPPLRERRADISLLARHFVNASKEPAQRQKQISDTAMRILKAYDWPGNVRELEHVVRRALILCHEEEITPDALPKHVQAHEPRLKADGQLRPLEAIETEYIQYVLEEAGGHRGKAAAILGISERTLYRKLIKLEQEQDVPEELTF